ncbi:MAG: TrkA family potassium uptake protein [Lachnospiraceae bacterium]|nr:TrkA family potassium uptake protein [Lachnospiraceae bacterium]
MKSILVFGAGSFGSHMIAKLYELGHDVLVVEQDEARLDQVMPYAQSGQIGDATDREFLASLGIDNFDSCIVTIGNNFEASLVTTSYLKELGARLIVARADSDMQEKFLKMAGADDVIFPERQLGEWAAKRYTTDHLLNYIQLEDGFAIYEVPVPESWVGMNLIELDIRRKHHLNVIAIKRDDGLSVDIVSENVFSSGDLILVVGKEEALSRFFR